MKWLGFCLSLLFLGVGSEAVRAQCPLDQAQATGDPSQGTSGVGGVTDKAQTFTVGQTGILGGIEIFIKQNIAAGNDLIVDVRITAAGVPIENDANTLAVRTIPSSSVPASYAFLFIDLSADNVVVNAGDVLAIVLRAPPFGSTDYVVAGSPNGYASGTTFRRNPDAAITTWTQDGEGDIGFKTFVCAPVPVETGSWGSVKALHR